MLSRKFKKKVVNCQVLKGAEEVDEVVSKTKIAVEGTSTTSVFLSADRSLTQIDIDDWWIFKQVYFFMKLSKFVCTLQDLNDDIFWKLPNYNFKDFFVIFTKFCGKSCF